MTIKSKLIINTIVTLLFLVFLAAAGLYSMSHLTGSLVEFAQWSDIDMVMNEAVTQNVLKTKIAMSDYSGNPSAESYDNLAKSQKAAVDGVSEWRGLLEGHAGLIRVSDSVGTALQTMAENIKQHRQATEKREKILNETDLLITEWLEMLDNTMVKVIDPRKEEVSAAEDIPNMIKWSNIDMLMNEGIIANALRLQTLFHDYANRGSATDLDKLREQITATGEGLKEWRDVLQGEEAMETAADKVATYLNSINEKINEIQAVFQLAAELDAAATEETQKLFAELESGMETIIDPAKDEAVSQAERAKGLSVQLTIGALIVSLIILVVFNYLLIRGIIIPLRRGVNLANKIRDGDLSRRLKLNKKDEIAQLTNALDNMADSLENKANLANSIAAGDLTVDVDLNSDRDTMGMALRSMAQRLNEVLEQVKEASNMVDEGSNQVSDSSQALSQGATEQAASLEEITSSMTELASQTKINAENANQASQLSMAAKDAANSGNDQMQSMITAMSDIGESSKEIAKIIKAIDDIAFQTNLLALNAAVEAARAGKHGKGFAVVAQEVRSLAGRSAKAAHETAELIDGAVKKISSGTEIANKTAQALNNIVDGATKAADLVGEIAAASNEQAQGIAQINQGLSQVEMVTQQNTANAEETASASEELSSQAKHLHQLINTFKLKDMAVLPGRRPRTTGSDSLVSPAASPALEWGAGMAVPESDESGKILRPEDVISLDDKDFGKY